MVLEYNLQFFAKDGEGGEKTEAATPRKLEKAREEGQVAKSQDLNTAVLLTILFLSLRVFGGYMADRIFGLYRMFYGNITDYVHEEFTVGKVAAIMNQGMMEILWIILPILALAVLGAVVVNIVQVKWKVTGKPLRPKLSKINPISGFKRMFSKDKLVELLKAILKVGILFYVVYSALKDQWGMITNIYQLDVLNGLLLILNTALDAAFRICVAFLILAFADRFYQKKKFAEDMKMTN